MTDREIIIKIIKKNGTYNGRSLSFDYYVVQLDDLADALIAAGIGDVTEWKEKVECAKRILQIPTLPNGTTDLSYFEYKGERIQDIARQRDEYSHRAEVAEKALKEFAGYVGCERCPYSYQCELPCVDSSNDYRACFETYVRQAEEALAEEKKDD